MFITFNFVLNKKSNDETCKIEIGGGEDVWISGGKIVTYLHLCFIGLW